MDVQTAEIVRNLAYLLASLMFIFGLKGLTHPRTAVRGNLTGACGMLLAVVVTLVASDILSWVWIITGLVVGSAIGTVLALKVPVTGMPQMMALFNGFGGAASFLVAGAEFAMASGPAPGAAADLGQHSLQFLVAIAAAGLIGAVTLFGSLVAFGKLAEFKFVIGGKKYWSSSSILLPGRHFINALVAVAMVGACVLVVTQPTTSFWYWVLVAVASLLGVLITIPIGGADMPVVIALLNSYSGLAACATGFVLNNNVLIIAGSLVGASGLILSSIMCKAMNRSLANVLFSGFGSTTTKTAKEVTGEAKPITAEDAYYVLEAASSVVFVPGYGMAVAQAQHAVRELGDLLQENGAEVKYAVHPVAGRMPGHMNVLLAEANVPYEQLVEMEAINPVMDTVDVAIVIGANDVVNPAAREDEGSPIYGMPIINVDYAKTVFVLKRSMRAGFAGVDNPLFFAENTRMLFGDAKRSVEALVTEFKT